jgi:D-glycero-alpha-D-manno-heptose 1-phosphate guanylyltransferase
MEALILAGGLGTRLASVVTDRAKPVAEVAGRPFLLHLLEQIERCAAVDRVTLCVGHKADTVERALGKRFGRVALRYSLEHEPLGTGGALRRALRGGRRREACLAMNGDSFVGIRLDRLVQFHAEGKATASLALARVPDASRFGAARLSGDKVLAFSEKGTAGPAWINAGIYVLSAAAQEALQRLPKRFSFEREALGPWCAQGKVRGMRSRARFIDIGLPAEYARAAALFAAGRR